MEGLRPVEVGDRESHTPPAELVRNFIVIVAGEAGGVI